jgi:hypothetical protein
LESLGKADGEAVQDGAHSFANDESPEKTLKSVRIT